MIAENQATINYLTYQVINLQTTIQERIGLSKALELIKETRASKGEVSEESLKEIINIYQEYIINYLTNNKISESTINKIANKYKTTMLTEEGFNDYLIDCFKETLNQRL